ncbi:MAG: small-conductance mechanosensitive channel [Desulforhopalus sp.]|jgi:small-conductance mechanosensitive channel
MKSRMTGLSLLLAILSLLLFTASVKGNERVVSDTPPDQQQVVEVKGEEGMEPDRIVFMAWLSLLDEDSGNDSGKQALFAHFSKVPKDLGRAFRSIGGPAETDSPIIVLLRSIIALAVGFLITIFLVKVSRKKAESLNNLTPPDSEGQSLLILNIIKSLPELFTLIFFIVSSILVFLLLAGDISGKGRMLFQLILGFLFILQLSRIIAKLLLSPDDEQIRFVTIDTQLAVPLARAVYISMTVLVFAFLLGNFIFVIGLEQLTLQWCILFLGSAVIAVYALLVLNLKQPVVNSLLAKADKQKSWLKQQLYTYWHVPALFYLLSVWLLWVGQLMSGEVGRGGSFLVSMMLVPIYFILSSIGKILITATVDSLGIVNTTDTTSTLVDENAPTEEEIAERLEAIISKSHTVFKGFIISALLAWVMALWGYKIPFASVVIKALFESIVIIAVALVSWRFASSYIERKIEEATPEIDENEQDNDDEFGGAVARGRSHTLLPMLRKVLGTILMVMVVLIVISSMGVDIAPLLAGAGVVGLAVGFGAQKLVSDIFSGFFFLLDDAFRVGEYIQAGTVKGTVEGITLRNVMLRHHLGMLQIVPHSDLGAITNCMRGGMVIKFPLEFPYDTDIDKVRRIIKKVGQAMLEDEEIGDDFILPVKSQGVNEITNSVMVIRVKFTSKPGKQFVIKREAFRRITEALNAKGIYYAHRKVIVDLPPESDLAKAPESIKQKVLQAGAATVQDQPPEGETKKEPGMFE